MRFFQGDTQDEIRNKLEAEFENIEIGFGFDLDLSITAVDKVSKEVYKGSGYINQLPHKEIWRVKLEKV